ncbi:hypothetical protein [Rhizosaccharibacter radicis]|uniref:Translation initiation factor IF-2 n=1 Tax=Rhizosaccharibacter radicis TaxID=2782605 RepID=A0ABT1VV71_9PROT|nr:hypothetical protein [Acetobacteraceae bacterium KSS12]
MISNRTVRAVLAGGGLAMLLCGGALAQPASPRGDVSSGQRITGHNSTHKDAHSNTGPEQPAPAKANAVAPSKRLPEGRVQEREQVAPSVDAPVKPGTRPKPGQDIPH